MFFYSYFKAKSVICTCMQKKNQIKKKKICWFYDTLFIFIMIAVSRKWKIFHF